MLLKNIMFTLKDMCQIPWRHVIKESKRVIINVPWRHVIESKRVIINVPWRHVIESKRVIINVPWRHVIESKRIIINVPWRHIIESKSYYLCKSHKFLIILKWSQHMSIKHKFAMLMQVLNYNSIIMEY